MNLKKLYDPVNGEMKVIGLMSGTGSNLKKVLENEMLLKNQNGCAPYHVIAIFSDNYQSRAGEIGREFNLPVITRDINAFYAAHGLPKRDMSLREVFDAETVKALAPYNADCAIYAGYMSIASKVLIDAYLGVNVHPADLSVTLNGKRRWTGDHAVRDAISGGEKEIHSTTHLVEPVVDGGRILMISRPLKVEIPHHLSIENPIDLAEIETLNQQKLKQAGDWVVLPKTIEYIASGRFAFDSQGNLYFDSEPVPRGVRL